MSNKYDADKPIYLQIIDRISREIVRGDIKPGDKLPSVREMAIQSGVNPNTIQRTYSELERMEVVETKRGQGTFVTENLGMVVQLKKSMQASVVENFVKSMREIGVVEKEIINSVEEFLSKGEGKND
ncbi:GntR family transcriptional regulator [Bacillus tianshenii]|uniref:GntR family transcriptional regulator n=1 Tax=Sutcliffiella tianshenii TaxID=1463404 RepID=A0ABS2P454_9BACI|nr:GntR family transcriptional regulator [Bacillus tianshenii]MBM7621488.1 GntR family transcriptional regulator [Bacillus tianshenii]MCA1319219.1 GntR family transcriptional regulator [Bacillus tianshenii]